MGALTRDFGMAHRREHKYMRRDFTRGGPPLPRYRLSRCVVRVIVVAAVAMAMAEALVYVIYGIVDAQRTAFHMGVTATVTFLVAVPISFFFSLMDYKLALATANLVRQAQYDHLSKLYNRGTFIGVFERIIDARGGLADPRGALLYLDADHFKKLNDTFGHASGDRAIEILSQTICDEIRSGDFAGRIGGEEFGVVLRDVTRTEAAVVAERIRLAVEANTLFRGSGSKATVSIGVAFIRSGDTVDDLMRRADECLYHAKALGRNRVVVETDDGPEGGRSYSLQAA